jgi:hypothetical protein
MPKLYTKDTWTDEVLADDALYKITDPAGDPIPGSVTDLTTAIAALNSLLEILETGSKISLITDVSVAGTPLTATRMNNIEDGIDALDDLLVALQAVDNTGWTPARETWAYASATTITVPSGAVSKYSVGTKIRYQNNDSGTYLYDYIVGVADTLLTVVGDAVPNATLTDNYYSNVESPIGFPHWFNWTATYTGFSTAPTDVLSRFCIVGNILHFVHNEGTNGTSNANYFGVSLPVPAKTVANSYWGGMCFFAIDNTAQITTACRWNIDSAGTSVFLYTNMGTGAWTTSGGKRARLQGWYEI